MVNTERKVPAIMTTAKNRMIAIIGAIGLP